MTDTSSPKGTTTPQVGYWHLWTDARGVSHRMRCRLERFELGRIGTAAPQWNDAQPSGKASVVFTVLPVGWIRHRPPQKRRCHAG